MKRPERLPCVGAGGDYLVAQGLQRGFHARARHVMGRHGLELPSLAEFERMLADRKGGTKMTTLMEATFQKHFDEIEARGMEQGIAQGHADLLRHQAERRFGAEAASRLAGLLAGMDTARLTEVGDWMLECRTAGELLDRLNHKD